MAITVLSDITIESKVMEYVLEIAGTNENLVPF